MSSTASFSDFKLNKQILSAVADAGFIYPTPVQQKAIPQILAGHDLIGIAQTGTGKTAAYLLPLLMKIKKLQMLVMDEAERLLDMSFKKQVNSILDILPTKRQNLLFSATMSDNVKAVADNFMNMPAMVDIAPERKTAKGISQVLYFVP